MFGIVPFSRNNLLRRDFMDLAKIMDNFFEDRNVDSSLRDSSHFKVDVKDTGKEYIVEAELPGVNKEDIGVKIENDILMVSVCTNEEKSEENENYIRKERRSGSYYRTFKLEGIKDEQVNASYKDGILSITLPKDEDNKSKGRNIEIH